jgi:hypothetical protein
MRQKYNGITKDQNGKVLVSATVSVFLTGTSTAASIYTTLTGATAVNSVISSSVDGTFSFFVDRFDYEMAQAFDLVVSKTNYTSQTVYNVSVVNTYLGTYTISVDKTLTTHLVIPDGVIYSISSGKVLTLTSPSQIDIGNYYYNVFTGAGSVAVTGGSTYTPASTLTAAVLKSLNTPYATTTEVKAQTEAEKCISPLTLAALVPALGSANLKQFMNAGATSPEWASGVKIGTFTKDSADAGADVAYTGVGFKPSSVIFLCNVSTTTATSIGFDTQSAHGVIFDRYAQTASVNWAGNSSYSIIICIGVGVEYDGAIKTFDADGFTITWTKTGNCTGTISVFYLAFR